MGAPRAVNYFTERRGDVPSRGRERDRETNKWKKRRKVVGQSCEGGKSRETLRIKKKSARAAGVMSSQAACATGDRPALMNSYQLITYQAERRE